MQILKSLLKICDVKSNVDLKFMCSMHIGGLGSYVCYPENIKQIKKLFKFLYKNNIPYFILGNGTNVVFEDCGYSAVLVCMKKFNKYKIKGNNVIANSGLNLFALNYVSKCEELSGLEWSYGIPGTVGGAVKMNAGAYGSEMSHVVKCVWVLRGKRVKKLKPKQIKFGYRHSVFHENNDVILKVEIKLTPSKFKIIDQKQKQIFAYRKVCQPYDTYNAGSIFKKTSLGSAGKTIDKLGLKGVKIGDIQISNKHANFFVNLGNGTSKDLHALINFTKDTVLKKEGILLEEEIFFVKNIKDKNV